MLNRLHRKDKNHEILESTEFEYSNGGNTYYGAYPDGTFFGDYLCDEHHSNPSGFTNGSLKKVILPTGGMIEYNFEPNRYYVNKNDPQYIENNLNESYLSDPEIQYIRKHSEITFDTHNATEYIFHVDGPPLKYKRIYIQFNTSEKYSAGSGPGTGTSIDPDTQMPVEHLWIDYEVKPGDIINSSMVCGLVTDISSLKAISVFPGTYTLKMKGTGGKGTFTLYEGKNKPLPYRNEVSTDEQSGIRIGSIKYYDSSSYGSIPKKAVYYEYNDFSDEKSSSGYRVSNENNGGDSPDPGFILYRNVKVSQGTDNGYVKYYFRLPGDYPAIPDYTSGQIFWPYYNITKKGILEKREEYNNTDAIVSSARFEYTFATPEDSPEYTIFGFTRTKLAYIKEEKTVSETFFSNAQHIIRNETEARYNTANFKLAYSKEILSEGTISEKIYSYAAEQGVQKLIAAHITGVPVATEIRNNGKKVAHTVVKYENQANLYPSSVVNINPNDNTQKTGVRYDAYDSKGNVRQFTSHANESTGAGTPTVLVWGYSQTYPIAKIEGARLEDIGNLADDIILKSDADTDRASENALIKALDNFRSHSALKNFVITTYTYDPLIGATTVTPPTGIRQLYSYDKSGRLISVTDVNGNIVNEYKYNTKPLP